MLGPRTGVGEFCVGALDALGRLGAGLGIEPAAFAVTWRRRAFLVPQVPAGVVVLSRSMPARPLHALWGRTALPPAEWFLGPIDVVHGTNYVVPPTRRAARVLTVHDLTTTRFPELCDDATLRFPELVRRAVADGAFVHTPSRFVADEVVAEFGVDPARVRAVHHGIPGPLESAMATAPASGVPAVTGRYVLAVGTVEPRKDYPGLVRAFTAVAGAVPDVALVIAGRDGWGASRLDDAVAASPVRSRIVRTGYLAAGALHDLLARAAVLAFPSLYEGFGFPPLQAMAAGVPVVATAAGAVPEVVGDAALLVPPGDGDALGEALVAALQDDSTRRRLVDAGRLRSSSFTWDSCAAGLAQLYGDAAAERS
ncbi:MAG: glycosyltransferase family 4 protein [Acidimicrobiales bacterium]